MLEIGKTYNTDKNYSVVLSTKDENGFFVGYCLGPNGSCLNNVKFDKNGVSNNGVVGRITVESLYIDYLRPFNFSWCSQ